MWLFTCSFYWWTSEDREHVLESYRPLQISGGCLWQRLKTEDEADQLDGHYSRQVKQQDALSPALAGTLFQWTEVLEILCTSLWPSLLGLCLPFLLPSLPSLSQVRVLFAIHLRIQYALDTVGLWAQGRLQQPRLPALISCHGSWLYPYISFVPFIRCLSGNYS